jgi:hypothetical protein
MRIELDRVDLAEGAVVIRGRGSIVQSAHAAIWYENGFVWVKPHREELRFYHPAGCTMYPKPGQSSVPALPGAAPAKAKAA